MTSEHYAADHSRSQSAAVMANLVDTPGAKQDQHEERPNL